MNIKEFLDKNNIRYVPIMLTVKDGKKTLANCTWYGDRKPCMDRVFVDPDYYQTRSAMTHGSIREEDYDFIAIDTSHVPQIDVDVDTRIFDKLKLPYFKSVSKSYGKHYFAPSFEELTGNASDYYDRISNEHVGEYLHGTWSFCNKSVTVVNGHMNPIAAGGRNKGIVSNIINF